MIENAVRRWSELHLEVFLCDFPCIPADEVLSYAIGAAPAVRHVASIGMHAMPENAAASPTHARLTCVPGLNCCQSPILKWSNHG